MPLLHSQLPSLPLRPSPCGIARQAIADTRVRWGSFFSSFSSSSSSSRHSSRSDDHDNERRHASPNVAWWRPIWDEMGTVPNAITMSRMVATPGLAYVILQHEYAWACAGLAVFGFSDWLDGYIARTYDQSSVLGTFLDPFADKMLIVTLALAEGWDGLLPTALVALIVGRDMGLVAGGFWMRAVSKPAGVPFFDTRQASALKVTPSLVSKFNTLFQVGVLFFALTNAAWPGVPGEGALTAMCWLTGATTFATGVDYFINRPIGLASDGAGDGGDGSGGADGDGHHSQKAPSGDDNSRVRRRGADV